LFVLKSEVNVVGEEFVEKKNFLVWENKKHRGDKVERWKVPSSQIPLESSCKWERGMNQQISTIQRGKLSQYEDHQQAPFTLKVICRKGGKSLRKSLSQHHHFPVLKFQNSPKMKRHSN
jgi:hypothetical protein